MLTMLQNDPLAELLASSLPPGRPQPQSPGGDESTPEDAPPDDDEG
jgi:hypothetical protein